MFTNTITPRFLETDAIGHINNTVLPMWFEASREGIFKIFNPEMNPSDWTLMLAGFNVNFHAETLFGDDVEIRTFISRIGNSSFDILQECWQQDVKTASGTATMVYFCHHTKKSQPITQSLLEQMQPHLTQDAETN